MEHVPHRLGLALYYVYKFYYQSTQTMFQIDFETFWWTATGFSSGLRQLLQNSATASDRNAEDANQSYWFRQNIGLVT